MKYYFKLSPYLRPYWRLAVGAIFFTILIALAGLLAPWPLKIVVDSVLGDQPLPPIMIAALGTLAADPFTLLVFAAVASLGIVLLEHGLTVLNEYVQTRLAQNVALDFRSALFMHTQRLSLAYQDQRQPGSLIYPISFESERASELIMTILPLVQNILSLVGMFWISFLIDQQLALLSLVVVPLLYVSVGYYTARIQPRLDSWL